MLSSVIFPKYDDMISVVLFRNSNTIGALRFCFVTDAIQMFPFLMWKKLVPFRWVTGERTWPRAWITFTRNASAAWRLKENWNYIRPACFFVWPERSLLALASTLVNQPPELVNQMTRVPKPLWWNYLQEKAPIHERFTLISVKTTSFRSFSILHKDGGKHEQYQSKGAKFCKFPLLMCVNGFLKVPNNVNQLILRFFVYSKMFSMQMIFMERALWPLLAKDSWRDPVRTLSGLPEAVSC